MHYDAVVIGSGFGGASVALALARAGLKTAVIERGGWAKRDGQDWDPRAILLEKRYRSPSPVHVRLYGASRDQVDHPNETVGGMSVFYGGASLRLRMRDFDRWPVSYEDFEPFYDAAERCLEVHGSAGDDPCEPPRSSDYVYEPVELTDPARRIFDSARSLGYRPFHLPLAINFRNPARTLCIRCVTCDGFPCKIEAKNDLTATMLRDAQRSGLEIVASTVVTALNRSGSRVNSITCVSRDSRGDDPREISASTFILSAGAVQSPVLLMRSKLDGNPSVGHYLMRHCNAIVTCVFRFPTNPRSEFHKQVCLTDFYEENREESGTAVGVIQDIYTPDRSVLRRHAPWWGRWLINMTHDRLQNLLCVAEDDAQYENRVFLSRQLACYGLQIPRIHHDYSDRDYARCDRLAGRAVAILKAAGGHVPYRYRLDTFSHAVGTLRMGATPEEGAIDPSCKLWDAENVYVSDGSFMPFSGGVNPSLTIAANGFRVAQKILEAVG